MIIKTNHLLHGIIIANLEEIVLHDIHVIILKYLIQYISEIIEKNWEDNGIYFLLKDQNDNNDSHVQ